MRSIPYPTVLAAVVWLGLLFAGLPVFQLQFNNDTWLAEDHPVELGLDRLARDFEPGETLLLLLPLEEDFFVSRAMQNRLDRLEKAIGRLPLVTETLSPLSAQTLIEIPASPLPDDEVLGDRDEQISNAVLEIGSYLSAIERDVLRQDFDAQDGRMSYRQLFQSEPYASRLLSSDAMLAAIQVRLNTRENQQARREAFAQIRSLAEPLWGSQYRLVGAAAIKNEINLRIGDSALRLLLGALAGMLLLLRLLLASWPRTLLVAACASGCTLVAMSWLPRLGVPLSAPGLILPVMIVTVGLADALHLLMYWDRIRDASASSTDAVLKTFRALWLPCFSASLTTAIGCGAFIFSEIVTLSEFSLIAIFGIFSAYPLMIFPLLAALALQPDWFGLPAGRAGRSDSVWSALLGRLQAGMAQRPGRLLLLALLPMVFLVTGLFRLHTESNFLAIFFPEDADISRATVLVDEQLGGSGSMDVILDGKKDGHFRLHAAMEKVVALEAGLSVPDVNRVDSYATPLRQVDSKLAKRDGGQAGRSLPRSDEELENELFFLELSRNEEKRGVLEPYTDFTYSAARLDLHTPNLLSADLDRLIHRLKERLDASGWGEAVTITGFGVFLHQLGQLILDTQIESLLWTLGLIALIFFLQFRPLPAVLGILANGLPIAATAGTISWLGLPYDFGSILVTGVTLGFAVDDSLHLLHRHRSMTGSPAERAGRAVAEAGPAILTAGVTLGFGLLLLLSSSLVLIDRFAIFSVLGLVLSLICALLVLPILLSAPGSGSSG